MKEITIQLLDDQHERHSTLKRVSVRALSVDAAQGLRLLVKIEEMCKV